MPMSDANKHHKMGVNAEGKGPYMFDEVGFDHYICWCGESTCELYKENN